MGGEGLGGRNFGVWRGWQDIRYLCDLAMGFGELPHGDGDRDATLGQRGLRGAAGGFGNGLGGDGWHDWLRVVWGFVVSYLDCAPMGSNYLQCVTNKSESF
jgi:hypothetical protein